MARPLPILPMQKLHYLLPSSFTSLIVLTVIFSVISVVTFLCGSRHKEKKTKTVRLGGQKTKPPVKRVETKFSSKALLMAKIKKVRDGGEEEELDVDDDGQDGAAVWKKTIIKGDRCRPLDFSGRILYDSNGNLLPE
ncbi:hypothetical protein C2S53_019343 [Perilla frutescens var. hirtella]|uniref:Transmembrane protein n=1 Tax=Perilla frutescens var. hirtella TaxID=608512 RepID=A0AAD4NW92_PERFH|nr:hypothetical protein C2S53_019343 [Perilla frutescens var. hirtella]